MDYFSTLQSEVREWSVRNFGDNPEHRALLGMNEELGELQEALFDWGTYDLSEITKFRVQDAIGDFMIYAADYTAKKQWVRDDWKDWTSIHLPDFLLPNDLLDRVYVFVGKMCHHQLKSEQGIRGSAEHHSHEGCEAFLKALPYMKQLSILFGFTLEEAVTKTWEHVKKRDFNKNKLTGEVPAET